MLPIRDTQTITQEKDSHLIREWNIFVPGLNRLLDPRRHASPDALKNTKAQVLETGKIMSQLKGSNKSEMTQWLEEETAKLLSDFLQDLHYVYSTCRPTERSWAKLNQYFQNLDAIGDEGLTICDTTESDLCQLGKSTGRTGSIPQPLRSVGDLRFPGGANLARLQAGTI